MNNVAILDCNFGDTGKARVAHYFSRNKGCNWTVRPHSGASAGHTIYHDGTKIVRHLVPSADFSKQDNKAFLASGMVIDLEELLFEVTQTEKAFPGSAKRIFIDPNAFIVHRGHIDEDKDKNGHIGSTNKGITPAYKDKIGRVGTKISHLIRDNAEIIAAIKETGARFKYLLELKEEMEKTSIVFEGSQSILLDLEFGDYPYCTSAQCGLNGIYSSGFAFAMPKTVYGISKATYWTKSGGGQSSFPTEMPETEANKWRELAGEYGATTKRPRRIGWIDLPALKYSIISGGITNLILTKADLIDSQHPIQACHSYGKPMLCGNDIASAKPEYKEMKGWADCRNFSQTLPFIEEIEKYTGVPVSYISVGTSDNDMLEVPQGNERKNY